MKKYTTIKNHRLFENTHPFTNNIEDIKILPGYDLFNMFSSNMYKQALFTVKINKKINSVGFLELSDSNCIVFLAGIGSHNYIEDVRKYQEKYNYYKAMKIFNKLSINKLKQNITEELLFAGRQYIESLGMKIIYLFKGSWLHSTDKAEYKGKEIRVDNITIEKHNMGVMMFKFYYSNTVFFLGVTDTMTNRLASKKEKLLFQKRFKIVEDNL